MDDERHGSRPKFPCSLGYLPVYDVIAATLPPSRWLIVTGKWMRKARLYTTIWTQQNGGCHSISSSCIYVIKNIQSTSVYNLKPSKSTDLMMIPVLHAECFRLDCSFCLAARVALFLTQVHKGLMCSPSLVLLGTSARTALVRHVVRKRSLGDAAPDSSCCSVLPPFGPNVASAYRTQQQQYLRSKRQRHCQQQCRRWSPKREHLLFEWATHWT